MEIGSILTSLPALISMIPVMMQVSQILFFLFFIWFFGQMSMRGFVARKPFYMGIAGTLLTGTLCLLASSAFAGFLPFFSTGIFRLFGVDMVIAGIIASALIAVALNLITRSSASKKPLIIVEELRRKVMQLEDILSKKPHRLHEKDVRRIAENEVHGYKVSAIKLVGHDYDVKLKKGESVARLIIDSWDGEIRKKIIGDSAVLRFFTDPKRIMGLLILIAVSAGTAFFFEGFSSPMDEMSSMFGFDVNEIGDMTESLGDSPFMMSDIPEGCVSMLVFTQYYEQFQNQDFILNHVFEDDQMSRMIEDNCGRPVVMIKIDHEGTDLIIAVTENSRVGYVTGTTFCSCVETLSA
ncbi:MAG: hypothetical protein JW789_04440 [Candidatus Aenigmarchaeota archaeon]|nr:hypothetical protein [Candidatus Aenigmarchaeota archaeon]